MKFKVQEFGLTDSLKHLEAVTSIGWINSEEILSIGDDHQLLRWNVSSGKAQNIPISYSSNVTNINEYFFCFFIKLNFNKIKETFFQLLCNLHQILNKALTETLILQQMLKF